MLLESYQSCIIFLPTEESYQHEIEDEAGVESQLLDEGLGEGLPMDLGRSLCMLDWQKDGAILASSPGVKKA
jgi:hypothetical protein